MLGFLGDSATTTGADGCSLADLLFSAEFIGLLQLEHKLECSLDVTAISGCVIGTSLVVVICSFGASFVLARLLSDSV